ncbi:MAG: hypothetical protein LBE91_20425 [Tannerella sp.]|jgi:hypothetical protein|nr:hypothetical protein [Tannerella sp.]
MIKKLIYWNFAPALMALTVDTEHSTLTALSVCYGYFLVSALLLIWKQKEIMEWQDSSKRTIDR